MADKPDITQEDEVPVRERQIRMLRELHNANKTDEEIAAAIGRHRSVVTKMRSSKSQLTTLKADASDRLYAYYTRVFSAKLQEADKVLQDGSLATALALGDIQNFASLGRDLPVRSLLPRADSFLGQENIVALVDRPEELAGVPTGYAIYVQSECMVPRYWPGDLLHIDPTRPLLAHDGCVIIETDGAFIAELLSQKEDKYWFCQYHPERQELSRSLDEVSAVHKIVGIRAR